MDCRSIDQWPDTSTYNSVKMTHQSDGNHYCWKNGNVHCLAHQFPSAKTEGEGFMNYTADSHHRAIKSIWLHF